MQQSWLLIAASFCFGLLIAVSSAALSPIIRQNEINKRNRIVTVLLPEAKDIILLDEQVEIHLVQIGVDGDFICYLDTFNHARDSYSRQNGTFRNDLGLDVPERAFPAVEEESLTQAARARDA